MKRKDFILHLSLFSYNKLTAANKRKEQQLQIEQHLFHRSSRPEVFCQEGCTENFFKIYRKIYAMASFISKGVGRPTVTLLKMTPSEMFFHDFRDFSQNTYLR